MKNVFINFFAFFIVFIFVCHFSFADDILENEETVLVNSEIVESFSNVSSLTPSSINSRSCIVYDRNSKMTLYGKNEKNKVKMASTTKIMTATIVIENTDLTKTIEVSKKAAGTGGSRLGLKTGDKITVNDLLYGLMLCSGNDAAVALAEYVGGSISGFADLMNQKASVLGLTNTHFESPHGLDSENHYTTAYELAKLTDYALGNDIFLKIVCTKNYTVAINSHSKTLSNTNELLGNLQGIYGVKTGFTNGANRCLVTACKRGDTDIICVVLGADTKKFRTTDSVKLIEYSFKNFTYINANKIASTAFDEWKDENLNNLYIEKSCIDIPNLSLTLLENPILSIKRESLDKIEICIEVNENLEAPISANTSIGTVKLIFDSNNIITLDIISSNNIDRKDISYYFSYFFSNYFNILEKLIE